jgi:hypothetical protein
LAVAPLFAAKNQLSASYYYVTLSRWLQSLSPAGAQIFAFFAHYIYDGREKPAEKSENLFSAGES